MINVIRAESIRLARRPALAAAAGGAALFAVVASVAVFLAAGDSGRPAGRGETLASLAGAGGGSAAFALGVSFAGLLVLVLAIVTFTGEFSRGTLRTVLMREPRRLRLLAGKMVAIMGAAGLVLALAAVLTWGASLVMAATQGVSTAEWFTLDALGENLADYGTAVVTVSGWATLGMALGMILRSTPLALAVGVAWAGPLEHITVDSWSAAGRWFPGLLLEALAAGGTDTVSLARAAGLVAVYVALAAVAAALVLRRRDIGA